MNREDAALLQAIMRTMPKETGVDTGPKGRGKKGKKADAAAAPADDSAPKPNKKQEGADKPEDPSGGDSLQDIVELMPPQVISTTPPAPRLQPQLRSDMPAPPQNPTEPSQEPEIKPPAPGLLVGTVHLQTPTVSSPPVVNSNASVAETPAPKPEGTLRSEPSSEPAPQAPDVSEAAVIASAPVIPLPATPPPPAIIQPVPVDSGNVSPPAVAPVSSPSSPVKPFSSGTTSYISSAYMETIQPNKMLPTGAIAGIVIACVCLIFAVGFVAMRRRRQRRPSRLQVTSSRLISAKEWVVDEEAGRPEGTLGN